MQVSHSLSLPTRNISLFATTMHLHQMTFALKHICANFKPQVALPIGTTKLLGPSQSCVQVFSTLKHHYQVSSLPTCSCFGDHVSNKKPQVFWGWKGVELVYMPPLWWPKGMERDLVLLIDSNKWPRSFVDG